MIDWFLKRGKFIYYIVLILIALNLYTTYSSGVGLHSLIISAFSYPIKAGRFIYSKAMKLPEKLKSIESLKEENKELRKKVMSLEKEVNELRRHIVRMRYISEIVKIAGETQKMKSVACMISGSTRGDAVLFINCGREHGIKNGDAVLGPYGVVGRVEDAGRWFSSVATLKNPQIAIDAVTEKTRVRGIVEGGSELLMVHISQKIPPEKGELVLTSGKNGIFPFGIPIGRVDEVQSGRKALSTRCKIKSKSADSLRGLIMVMVLAHHE